MFVNVKHISLNEKHSKLFQFVFFGFHSFLTCFDSRHVGNAIVFGLIDCRWLIGSAYILINALLTLINRVSSSVESMKQQNYNSLATRPFGDRIIKINICFYTVQCTVNNFLKFYEHVNCVIVSTNLQTYLRLYYTFCQKYGTPRKD